MECDDAPDLATSEASEPTTQASPLVPLFFAQVAVGVGPAAVAAPTIWAQLSPHLCVLFAILPATNRVRVLGVVCAVAQFACRRLPLRLQSLDVVCAQNRRDVWAAS